MTSLYCIEPISHTHTHTHTPPMLCMLRDVTLVMNTLVMLSGLSPSGLGGPRSCSPSPFSKLYKKAGFKICCRTYKKILKWRRKKTKPGSVSLTRQNQLGHAAASGQNSVRGAASNFVFPSSGDCTGRVTTWGKEQTRSLFSPQTSCFIKAKELTPLVSTGSQLDLPHVSQQWNFLPKQPRLLF